MKRRSPDNVADAINKIGDHVDEVLQSKQTQRYFESIVLLYSLIEDVLRWMVMLQLLWDRSKKTLSKHEIDEIRGFSRDLNFFNATRAALAVGLIDTQLQGRIDAVRRERNDILHQAWLYERRSDGRVLRKKLEKVATLTSDLIGVVNKLVKKIGVDEAWEIFP
jgi:hypothetical protein